VETALKQRLVGASVIIALAVIFIPMFFDDSQNNNKPISIDIPQEPENLKHKIVSLNSGKTNPNPIEETIQPETSLETIEPKINTTETIIDMTDNTSENIPVIETKPIIKAPVKESKPIQKPKQKPKAEDIPKPKIKENKPVKVINNGNTTTDSIYRIKLGAFSNKKNAEKLKAQIIHNGLDANIEKDSTSGLYKVYSRQYTTLSAANNLNKKIQKLKLNLGKTTVETITKENNDVIEAQLDTGWIVQIGIFSSKENSLKLRDKIRNKGYICFVDEIITSKNKLNYRVRIGPYATREEAGTQMTGILKSMNLKGLLKPHEKKKVVTK